MTDLFIPVIPAAKNDADHAKASPEAELKLQYEKMLKFEEQAAQQGFTCIAGTDEAGRGPVAGPIFAAAVVIDPRRPLYGVNDSKKLSPKRREELFNIICERAAAYSIAMVTAKVIDQIGIGPANDLVLKQAVGRMSIKADYVLVDYFKLKDYAIPYLAITKGDSLSASIAAASILAKVSRDRYMVQQDKIYPQYGFAAHKGYGTSAHRQAIKEYGLCPEHRRSFLTKW